MVTYSVSSDQRMHSVCKVKQLMLVKILHFRHHQLELLLLYMVFLCYHRTTVMSSIILKYDLDCLGGIGWVSVLLFRILELGVPPCAYQGHVKPDVGQARTLGTLASEGTESEDLWILEVKLGISELTDCKVE